MKVAAATASRSSTKSRPSRTLRHGLVARESGEATAGRFYQIHELSRRSVAKFQAVNCAALPDTLFESEIFGYEKGAFTGAHDRKPGRLELANEGTLFLDEIGDMSLIAQAKLLRVLEERRFERLGGHKSISVDFRLISATNRPLEQFVRDGRFREDLYYRVNAFAIRLPSLRERQVDIPVLAQRFLARYCAAQGLPLDSKGFSREAIELLCGYHWPGNIRELESTVSRAALSAPGRSIRPSDIEFLHAAAIDLRRRAEPSEVAILSCFNVPRHDTHQNRVMRFLFRTTEPLLGPLRRMVPQVGMFDISPFLAFIIIWVLQAAIAGTLLRS